MTSREHRLSALYEELVKLKARNRFLDDGPIDHDFDEEYLENEEHIEEIEYEIDHIEGYLEDSLLREEFE